MKVFFFFFYQNTLFHMPSAHIQQISIKSKSFVSTITLCYSYANCFLTRTNQYIPELVYYCVVQTVTFIILKETSTPADCLYNKWPNSNHTPLCNILIIILLIEYDIEHHNKAYYMVQPCSYSCSGVTDTRATVAAGLTYILMILVPIVVVSFPGFCRNQVRPIGQFQPPVFACVWHRYMGWVDLQHSKGVLQGSGF